MISAADIKNLRERTGAGLMECKAAIERAAAVKGYDSLALAEGYLKFDGLAVSIPDRPGDNPGDGYRRWVDIAAKSWALENKRKTP